MHIDTVFLGMPWIGILETIPQGVVVVTGYIIDAVIWLGCPGSFRVIHLGIIQLWMLRSGNYTKFDGFYLHSFFAADKTAVGMIKNTSPWLRRGDRR